MAESASPALAGEVQTRSSGSEVHACLREAFLPAILRGAPAVIFAHNHPSGDPTPSPDDYRLQLLLEEAGRALGIDVPDHLVISETGVHSARSGFSPPPLCDQHPLVPHPGVESLVD